MLIIRTPVKILACAAAVVLCISDAGVYALTQDGIADKIKELERENRRLDSLISVVESDMAETSRLADLYARKLALSEEQVDYYSNLIYANEQELAAKEAEIARIEGEIAKREAELETAQADVEALRIHNEENLEKFGRLMAMFYMNGSVELAPFIQGSSDIYDAMIAKEIMDCVGRQNLDFMNELLQSVKEYEIRAQELDNDIIELEGEKQKLAERIELLTEKRAELDKYLEESKAVSLEYKSSYTKYKNVLDGLRIKKSTYSQSKEVNKAEADAFDRLLKEMLMEKQTDGEYVDGEWRWPLEPRFTEITTEFGYDPWRDGQHNGIDISGSGINWSNIYAAKAGVVTVAQTSYKVGYSYGKFIVIDHGGGYVSLYAHCNDIYVTVGQTVNAGDVIGAVGSTGWSTGPHLHFEIRIDGTPYEPRDYIGW